MARTGGVISAAEYRARQSEADFQAAVVAAAQLHGWDVFVFPNMIGNPRGWPDLLMLRDGVWRLRECKGVAGRLGWRQVAMIDRLAANGADVGIWRPGDWSAIERELMGR